MDKRVKKKWLAALRSGQYKQTQHTLQDAGAYCCLGVLCDLHAQETKQKWNDNFYLGQCSLLPSAVCKWAGFLKEELMCVPGGAYDVSPLDADDTLTARNDDDGWTFSEIADHIEETL